MSLLVKSNTCATGYGLDSLGFVPKAPEVVEAEAGVSESKRVIKVLTEEDAKEIVRLKNEKGKGFAAIARIMEEKYKMNCSPRKIANCYKKYCPDGEHSKNKRINWNKENLELLYSMKESGRTYEEIADVFNSKNGTKIQVDSFRKIYTNHFCKALSDQRGGGLDDLASTGVTDAEKADEISTEVFKSKKKMKPLTEEQGKEVVYLRNIKNKTFNDISISLYEMYGEKFSPQKLHYYYNKHCPVGVYSEKKSIKWSAEKIVQLYVMKELKFSYTDIAKDFNKENGTKRQADAFRRAYTLHLKNKKRGSDEGQEASQSSKKVCIGSLVDGEG